MTSTPSYYQPNSHLSVRTDQGDLSPLEVIGVFTPFTFSQVLLVRTLHGVPYLNFPSSFLLILKVYDPRYNLKECRRTAFHPNLPWSYQAELEAAKSRKPLPNYDGGGFPVPPEYDSEDEDADPVRWEEYLYQCADVNFRDELRAYKLLEPLQGNGIPRCFGSGRLILENTNTPRAISPRAILLEYLPNSKSLADVNPDLITPALVSSIMQTVKSFGPLGVTHGDLGNYGNIQFTFDPPLPPRACIIDFGGSSLRWGEPDEDWASIVRTQGDVFTLFAHLKNKLKGRDLVRFGLDACRPEP